MNTPNNTNTTNPTTSTPDASGLTWEARIRDAAVFLGLSIEEVKEALKELGVEKEPAGMEMLSDENITPFGDLMKVFGDARHIPIAKVRLAAKYLRGPKDSAKTDTISPEMVKMKEKYGIKPRLENIETNSLLEDYDPKRSDHPITIILKKRFENKAVIVFKPDSTEVDIEATANYIADLEQGFPEEETIESQGELVRIYKVGEIPNEAIQEDPLFKGQPLKRERSIINRANWVTVPYEARQFVRLAVEMEKINPEDKRDVQDIIKTASVGMKALKEEFPEVFLEYKERKNLNNLPNLTMTMKEAETHKINNPFGINRKY